MNNEEIRAEAEKKIAEARMRHFAFIEPMGGWPEVSNKGEKENP